MEVQWKSKKKGGGGDTLSVYTQKTSQEKQTSF